MEARGASTPPPHLGGRTPPPNLGRTPPPNVGAQSERLSARSPLPGSRTPPPSNIEAPPGGRLTPAVTGLAREAGYRALCTSRAGIWRAADGEWAIPRLAVLAGTAPDRFGRWVAQDAVELARLRLRHGVLSAAKRALGNRLYDRLRGVVLDGGADA